MGKKPSLRPNHALLATRHQWLINLDWRKFSIENHPTREAAFFVKNAFSDIFEGRMEFNWSLSQLSQLINIVGNGLKPQMVKCQCRRGGEDIKFVLLSGRLTPCPAFWAKNTRVTNVSDCLNQFDSVFVLQYPDLQKNIYIHYLSCLNKYSCISTIS